MKLPAKLENGVYVNANAVDAEGAQTAMLKASRSVRRSRYHHRAEPHNHHKLHHAHTSSRVRDGNTNIYLCIFHRCPTIPRNFNSTFHRLQKHNTCIFNHKAYT